MSNIIATVAKIYLYPVKSMAGMSLDQAHVGLDGLLGDRQYAFVRADHAASNGFPWMTGRQNTRMVLYKARFVEAPTLEGPEPSAEVQTPAGNVYAPGDPLLREELARDGKEPVFLLKSARGNSDCQHVSLCNLATVQALSEDAGTIDHRQFRSNIYMDLASGQPFDEESWAGSLLQIGDEVRIGVTKRDGRCMMVNLDPDTATQNPKVLRTIVQRHEGQAGVYANVIRRGMIRVGDPIKLLPAS